MVVIITDNSYVVQSLINNLFFLRTIREFCLTLELTFYENYDNLIEISRDFGKRYEELGKRTLDISNDKIPKVLLESGSFVTDYTLNTELLTEKLFGVDINTNLTVEELNLSSGNGNFTVSQDLLNTVKNINDDAIELTDNFIKFCEYILNGLKNSQIFSYSYPLFFKFMIKEARLYVDDMKRLQEGTQVDPTYIINFQYWFSDSMRQICQFIIGLSDPEKTSIITNSDNYRKAFSNLMKRYQEATPSPEVQKVLDEEAIELVENFKEFLSKIINGILNQEYYFIMNPLFFDNLLTEANYFLYLLKGSMLGLND